MFDSQAVLTGLRVDARLSVPLMFMERVALRGTHTP